jgi:hypothetical protein
MNIHRISFEERRLSRRVFDPVNHDHLVRCFVLLYFPNRILCFFFGSMLAFLKAGCLIDQRITSKRTLQVSRREEVDSLPVPLGTVITVNIQNDAVVVR